MSNEYPSDWEKRRKSVYERDDYKCQNCGRRGGPYGDAELHAHHIVPKSKGGTHRTDNLKTLCSQCHDAIHTKKLAPTAKQAPKSTKEEVQFTSKGKIAGLATFLSYGGLIFLIKPILPNDISGALAWIIFPIHLFLLIGVPLTIATYVSEK